MSPSFEHFECKNPLQATSASLMADSRTHTHTQLQLPTIILANEMKAKNKALRNEHDYRKHTTHTYSTIV